jgi:hypothetical protein
MVKYREAMSSLAVPSLDEATCEMDDRRPHADLWLRTVALI